MKERLTNVVLLLLCALTLTSCTGPVPPETEPTSSPSPSSSAATVSVEPRPILYECDEDICSIDPRKPNQRVLIDEPGTQYLAIWAPDGRHFSYLDVAERGASLWVARRDGSQAKLVARNVDEFYDWAPDSAGLVVSRSTFIDYTLGFASDLYLVGIDGGVEQLTDSELSESMPAWSPDGGSIAFTGAARTRDGVNLDVYVLDMASGEVTRLTEHPAHDQEPRWSPDGSKIAFLTARHDPYDSEDGPYTSAIYTVDLRSGEEARLTAGNRADDRELAWSRDGTAIVFTHGWDDDVAHRRPSIAVVSLDGTIRQLARGSEPAWSPDGRQIAFARGDDSELYVISRDGSGTTRLTSNGTHDTRPSW